MSFSVTLIGSAPAILAALDAYPPKLTGQSRQEFEEALPHLKGLMAQNVNASAPQSTKYKLAANGHATFLNGKRTFGSLSVEIAPATMYGTFLSDLPDGQLTLPIADAPNCGTGCGCNPDPKPS